MIFLAFRKKYFRYKTRRTVFLYLETYCDFYNFLEIILVVLIMNYIAPYSTAIIHFDIY